MHEQVTFCVKTIHRPQCRAALVRSIYEHCGDQRPLIHVLDDGQPELRFSKHCPAESAMVDRLIETEYDIGLSAGRNRLLDSGTTPIVALTDDDHQVTEQTQFPLLVQKLVRSPVGPLMLIELATAIMLAWSPIDGIDQPFVYTGIGLVVLIWLSTAFIQVPCHEKLVAGFDLAAYKWLVNSTWIRAIAWTARGAVVTWMLVRMLSK